MSRWIDQALELDWLIPGAVVLSVSTIASVYVALRALLDEFNQINFKP